MTNVKYDLEQTHTHGLTGGSIVRIIPGFSTEREDAGVPWRLSVCAECTRDGAWTLQDGIRKVQNGRGNGFKCNLQEYSPCLDAPTSFQWVLKETAPRVRLMGPGLRRS